MLWGTGSAGLPRLLHWHTHKPWKCIFFMAQRVGQSKVKFPADSVPDEGSFLEDSLYWNLAWWRDPWVFYSCELQHPKHPLPNTMMGRRFQSLNLCGTQTLKNVQKKQHLSGPSHPAYLVPHGPVCSFPKELVLCFSPNRNPQFQFWS